MHFMQKYCDTYNIVCLYLLYLHMMLISAAEQINIIDVKCYGLKVFSDLNKMKK